MVTAIILTSVTSQAHLIHLSLLIVTVDTAELEIHLGRLFASWLPLVWHETGLARIHKTHLLSESTLTRR